MVELMIVVAIIAVLAAIFIPAWTKETKHGRYDPEVRAMFAEIGVKEEGYKSETGAGSYVAATACPTAVPTVAGVDFNAQACATAGGWAAIRVASTDSTVRCRYTIAAGAANSAGSAPTAPAGSGLPLPANSSTFTAAWYTLTAECDMDNAGGTNSTFYSASWDPSITKLNYGL